MIGAAVATGFGIPMVFLLAGVMCILGGTVALVGLPSVTLKDKVEDGATAIEPGPQVAEAA